MPDESSPKHRWWTKNLAAEWRFKLFLTVVLNAFFWSGYTLLSRYTFTEPRLLPTTWIDRAVPFEPAFWSWSYVSAYAVTPALSWLIAERSQLMRYCLGVVLLALPSFLIFALVPIASPRPTLAGLETGWLYELIVTLDGPYNAFPSLHAGFVVYNLSSGLLLHRDWLSRKGRFCFLLWGGAILYSTIATRQHYFLDLVAGGVLGWVAYVASWRTSWVAATASVLRRNSVQSQSGVR